MSDTSRWRLSIAHCPISPIAELHDLRMRIAAVVGVSRKQVQSRAVFIFDLVDHAHMGIDQRRQLGQKQPADTW